MRNRLISALMTNAAFSAVCGLGFICFSTDLAQVIGIGIPVIYTMIGIGLFLFAIVVFVIARKRPVNAFAALLISIADALWVIGTVGLFGVAFRILKPEGVALLSGIALLVMSVALWQLSGIGMLYRSTRADVVDRLCVTVKTPFSAETIWPHVADLAAIGRYSPTLVRVILRDGTKPGIGAVRQCTDQGGKTWAEHCTRFDAITKEIEMTFLTDEPGFPFPFKTMIGGWQVVPAGVGSIVRIWFEVTPKLAFLRPVILALMTRDGGCDFAEIVTRMGLAARDETILAVETPARYGVTYNLEPG